MPGVFFPFQFSLKAYLGLSSQPSRPGVLGAMDLGGASTQMTFLPEHPEETPAQYQTTLLLYGSTYKVYSHSYLCYGMAEGHRQYKAMLVKVCVQVLTFNYFTGMVVFYIPHGNRLNLFFFNSRMIPSCSSCTSCNIWNDLYNCLLIYIIVCYTFTGTKL